MTLTEFAPADWFPQFADYLALSFNTATAFGPTDVSAIKRWAKMMMIGEALISLTLATRHRLSREHHVDPMRA